MRRQSASLGVFPFVPAVEMRGMRKMRKRQEVISSPVLHTSSSIPLAAGLLLKFRYKLLGRDRQH
jgi:hypothetical protein